MTKLIITSQESYREKREIKRDKVERERVRIREGKASEGEREKERKSER